MKEKARELRRQGYGMAEIGEILGIPERRAKYYANDIKLTPEQQYKKGIERQKRAIRIKYETAIRSVNENILRIHLKKYGIHGTRQRLRLGESFVRFCIDKWKIPISEIGWYPRKSNVVVPSACSLCQKQYPIDQKRKRKFCQTCYSKIHRLLSKVRAISYKGGVCFVCKLKANNDNYDVFDFHHCNGDKDRPISEVLNGKWRVLKNELNKCILICSNCHRIIHAQHRDVKIISVVNKLLLKTPGCREGIDEHEGLTDGTGWGGHIKPDGSFDV
jgi:DNA-directed RNA polymerase subunit RPC12/RpoP